MMTLFRFLFVFKFLRVIAISWSDKIKVFPTTLLVPLSQVPTGTAICRTEKKISRLNESEKTGSKPQTMLLYSNEITILETADL